MQNNGAQGLIARLEAGTPIVLDGGIRGALRRRGVHVGEGLGSASVLGSESHALRAVHEAFCAAGAHILRTNTAQTTPEALQRVGYGYRAAKLTSLAVDLAREAVDDSGRTVCVAGVLPTLGSPDSKLRGEQVAHAERLAAAGCDLIFVEEAGSLRGAVAATSAALQTGLPVFVSLRVLDSGALPDGEGLDAVCGALAGAGAIGFMAVPSDPTGEMRAISALSSLGHPWGVLSCGAHDLSAQAYGARARELVAEGATLLAGEDLATPDHLRALMDAVPLAQRELRRGSLYPPPPTLRGATNLPPRI